MAASGQIHCLATDSHHPGWYRPAKIQATAAKLRKMIGQENYQQITTDNPLRVLNGDVLLPMKKPEKITERRKNRWWQFW
jgi:hypothetical protein